MKRTVKFALYPVLCALILMSLTSAVYADLEAVKQATVSITSVCQVGETSQVSSGSGFIVSSDGFIVTNAHVVISNDIAVEVKLGDKSHKVKGILCYHDDILDIAILKVQLGGLNYLELGDDSELKLGQRLFAVGSPLVFKDIFTDGIFSAYNEELGMIQHTAELSHGNSGGPLVTEEGIVMGVNTIVVAFPGESRYFFAIPSSIVKAVLNGVEGQTTLNEVKIDCDKTLATLEPPPVTTEPTPTPGTTTPAPTVPAVDITPSYVNQVIAAYPDGWMNYSSSYLLYSFDLPNFYTYQFSDDQTFIDTGMEFWGSYTRFEDPNLGAVPIVTLYIGFPNSESFYEFKKRTQTEFEAEDFVRDTSFEMEDLNLSMPGLEFDAYWFNGVVGTDFESLSRATYFIREKGNDAAYYCLDFTFNNAIGDLLDTITIPLMMEVLWTFSTDVVPQT